MEQRLAAAASAANASRRAARRRLAAPASRQRPGPARRAAMPLAGTAPDYFGPYAELGQYPPRAEIRR